MNHARFPIAPEKALCHCVTLISLTVAFFTWASYLSHKRTICVRKGSGKTIKAWLNKDTMKGRNTSGSGFTFNSTS